MDKEKGRQFSVSVILPVYNGERFISEAVESVQKQNYGSLEIIIVDDGSTDKTANVVAGLKGNIKYAYQKNAGPAVARNKGLEMASGSIIAFIDADDLWPQDKLAVQLEWLAQNPDAGIVRGQIQCLRLANGKEVKAEFEPYERPFVSYILGSALIRKSVFDKVGCFDPGLFVADDVDWFLRARDIGVKTIVLKRTTLLYRIHHTNISRQKLQRDSDFLSAIKRSIDRKTNNDD